MVVTFCVLSSKDLNSLTQLRVNYNSISKDTDFTCPYDVSLIICKQKFELAGKTISNLHN